LKDKIKTTPSMADEEPMGNGPINRHGMPQLPFGQILTAKWPVLDLGYHPDITPDRWRLTINGEVENPVVLTWGRFHGIATGRRHQRFSLRNNVVKDGHGLERRSFG
jgi:DMSO/TMAO reductase YedYZ molybdopterin-dependent catalytic subunit